MRRMGAEAVRAGHARVCLDVRDEAGFAAGHLAGSGHLPRGDFREHRAELPPRERPVLVVSDDPGESEAAAADLEAMGYADVAALEVPLAGLPDGHASRGPAVRLWQPAPFLAEVLPRVRPAGGTPPGLAADLAAGSGREAVFLALHGFEVEAWDWAPEALARATALARRSGVTIRAEAANLERAEPPLPAGRYALIVVFRFLHRPLFPAIERALAPGGWLVYETYRVGQERIGRPTHRRFLLEPGELACAFPGLSVVRYEEPEPPGGPITARLLARKPGDPRKRARIR
jgi:rhodanese-related sulfurtransferase